VIHQPRFTASKHRPPERAVESAFFWINEARKYIERGKIDIAVNRGHHCLDMLLMALLWPEWIS
jgi:hypothetical protein